MTKLNEEARWLGQEVGGLRDLEVVANEIIWREAEAHPEEPGLSVVAGALGAEAIERRENLRRILAERRGQALLIDLARYVETRGWLVAEDFGQTQRLAAPVHKFAVEALNKTWKKARKRARELETLNAHQRHELRKELKKLRYAVEFLSPLFATKRVDLFLKRLKKLQTVLGDLNDAVMVRAILSDKRMSGANDPGVERATGWVIGATQARAEFGWAGAKALWRGLEKTRLFWR